MILLILFLTCIGFIQSMSPSDLTSPSSDTSLSSLTYQTAVKDKDDAYFKITSFLQSLVTAYWKLFDDFKDQNRRLPFRPWEVKRVSSIEGRDPFTLFSKPFTAWGGKRNYYFKSGSDELDQWDYKRIGKPFRTWGGK